MREFAFIVLSLKFEREEDACEPRRINAVVPMSDMILNDTATFAIDLFEDADPG